MWGATDLVAMGDKVLCAMPGLATPFLKVSELDVTGKDKARIAQAGAFGNYGEPVERVRKNGKVSEIKFGPGRLLAEDALKKETIARYGR